MTDSHSGGQSSALVQAWQRTLPEMLSEADSSRVKQDEANPNRLLITIETAGHQSYNFDFTCEYVDDREVKVQFVDVERESDHIDERNDTVQQLIEDYVRHIHECAQALQSLTHA